jgi:hypothetical protein
MIETLRTDQDLQPTLWINRLFWIAGVYGIIVLLPAYFLENRISHDYPPAITHPELFYCFIGVGSAWQVAFFIIATDPRRYGPLMIPGALEKFAFAFSVAVLFALGRVPVTLCYFAAIDFVLGVLFVIAFTRLKSK